MRKQYKRKQGSGCALCKPHKHAKCKRWKTSEWAAEETGYAIKINKRLSDVVYVHGRTGERIRVAMFEATPIGAPAVVSEETFHEWFQIVKAKDVIFHNLAFVIDEL